MLRLIFIIQSVGLYHCGKGDYKRSDRTVAVSIYCDAFESADGFHPSNYVGFYRNFPPWYHRHENAKAREDTTTYYKTKIQGLLDQPGECLRDELDTLDFNELEGLDLSTVPPPYLAKSETIANNNDDWMLVDSVAKMKQCVKELNEGNLTELAFDLEAYNPSKYTQYTCLIQLSSNHGKEYVIDPLADGVWRAVSELNPIFADPNIVKIGHSISGLDVRCLHRDFGIFLCNVFDTYEAAKVLQLPAHGLANVCEYYGLTQSAEYEALKNQYQTTDWRRRPLSDEMVLYGRYDVHFLIQLRKLMMRDLTYGELFLGGEAESRLVAESLAATLQRIQDFEDGVEYETASEGEPNKLSPWEANENSADDENGLGENSDFARKDIDRRQDQQAFLTPMNSTMYDDPDRIVEDDAKTNKIADAKLLRMQPRLMSVISFSQERCLDMWDNKSEPYYRNSVFISLMQGPKKESRGKHSNHQRVVTIPLTKAQIQLYEELVRLRAYIAKAAESLPGNICSVDDLVHIASGRPTCIDSLRLINYYLPEILRAANDDSFLDHIFLLTRKSLKLDGIAVSPFDAIVNRFRVPQKGKHNDFKESWPSWKKGLLVTVLCGGVYLVILSVTRKRRK